MESKYTELEKWKQLKDNGDITEEEFNVEKQRILNSKEENTNSKPKRKGIKVITLLIIFIVIIGVIAALIITANLRDKIQYERIEITTNEGVTLQINKTNLDKGIAEIEKQKSVSNTIGIVYSGSNIQYYLVSTFDSSQDEAKSAFDYYMGGDIRQYSINTIDDDNGKVTDGNLYFIKSTFIYMPISSYDVKDNLYLAGGYLYDACELLVINYDNGNIKILNDQTNKIKTSREEDKKLSIFEKAIKYGLLSNKYESGITEKQLKELYENTTGFDENNIWIGSINIFYNSLEECMEDLRQANLLIENNLKGKTYKDEDELIILHFIDDDTLEINNQDKYKYEFSGESFEIIYGEDNSHLFWITDDGKIEYYNLFLEEVK